MRAVVGGCLQCQKSFKYCPCSSVAEHSLGKGEVMCSIHIMGTIDSDVAVFVRRSGDKRIVQPG